MSENSQAPPAPVPEDAQAAAAIEAPSAERANRARAPLGPEDFYMEGALLVFTAAYHLRRGYCCNSSCRHCPYKELAG
jgi:hypothetical protein